MKKEQRAESDGQAGDMNESAKSKGMYSQSSLLLIHASGNNNRAISALPRFRPTVFFHLPNLKIE
jgi:hypothetical protein